MKAARARLKTLSALADRDPGQLVWLAYVAMEWGERELLRTSVAKLVQLIAAGAAKLTAGAVHVLQQCGYLPEIQNLVRTAQPVHYESLEELAYVFELARERGAYATGLAFGEAILRVAPDHRRLPKRQKRRIGPISTSMQGMTRRSFRAKSPRTTRSWPKSSTTPITAATTWSKSSGPSRK